MNLRFAKTEQFDKPKLEVESKSINQSSKSL